MKRTIKQKREVLIEKSRFVKDAIQHNRRDRVAVRKLERRLQQIYEELWKTLKGT
jgi:hypothetical protein